MMNFNQLPLMSRVARVLDMISDAPLVSEQLYWLSGDNVVIGDGDTVAEDVNSLSNGSFMVNARNDLLLLISDVLRIEAGNQPTITSSQVEEICGRLNDTDQGSWVYQEESNRINGDRIVVEETGSVIATNLYSNFEGHLLALAHQEIPYLLSIVNNARNQLN